MSENCHDCKYKTELLNLSHDTISKIAARAEAAELQLRDQESITADYLQVCKQRDDARRLLGEAIERCARIAEEWAPPLPPEFNSPALTAAGDQLDAKIRPIQIEAAKNVAAAIRLQIENRPVSGRSCKCSCHGVKGPNACGCCYYPAGGGPVS